MSLFPTKTRLALLTAVDNNQVSTDVTDDDVILLFPNAPTEWQTRRKVTARVRELEHAGWVTEDPSGFWRVAPAGRSELDADRRQRPVETIAPAGGVL